MAPIKLKGSPPAKRVSEGGHLEKVDMSDKLAPKRIYFWLIAVFFGWNWGIMRMFCVFVPLGCCVG